MRWGSQSLYRYYPATEASDYGNQERGKRAKELWKSKQKEKSRTEKRGLKAARERYGDAGK